MITEKEAIRIVKKHIPKGKIQRYVVYKDLYLFVVFTPDPYEGQMDAIYSVHRQTGAFQDFAYLDPEVFDDVMTLLENAPEYKEPPKTGIGRKIRKYIKLKK